MAGRARFRWTTDNLSVNLRNAPARVDRAVLDAMNYQAKRSQNYMRQNATWTDRTANARNGLMAVSYRAGSQYNIVLFHSMPYGIWLEVRWSGKYGIIPESVRQGGQELMSMLTNLFQAVSE